jgi:hypothetical protein
MAARTALYGPLTHPGYLPELLNRLKRLHPQVGALYKLLTRSKTPASLATEAPLLAYLLEVLPLLPGLEEQDLYPPPAPTLPGLVVQADGKVHLSQQLIAALNLRAGQPINLLPPYAHGDTYWYLDLRATAPHNIDWYPGKRAKIKRVELPPSLPLPEQGLTLLLLPGPPAYEGFYPMISYPT